MDPLIDADGFIFLVLVTVGIANIAEFPNELALQSGFFPHFAQRRFFDPLAFFHMALRKPPPVAHVNQGGVKCIGVSAVDHAAR